MCPHNVGNEQGRLNLKAEERDLWGGNKKRIKSIWQRLGGGVEQKNKIYFVAFIFLSVWQRLGGGVEQKEQKEQNNSLFIYIYFFCSFCSTPPPDPD